MNADQSSFTSVLGFTGRKWDENEDGSGGGLGIFGVSVCWEGGMIVCMAQREEMERRRAV